MISSRHFGRGAEIIISWTWLLFLVAQLIGVIEAPWYAVFTIIGIGAVIRTLGEALLLEVFD